jgi:hypothetical protein
MPIAKRRPDSRTRQRLDPAPALASDRCNAAFLLAQIGDSLVWLTIAMMSLIRK